MFNVRAIQPTTTGRRAALLIGKISAVLLPAGGTQEELDDIAVRVLSVSRMPGVQTVQGSLQSSGR